MKAGIRCVALWVAAAAATQAAEHEVRVFDSRFDPANLTIQAGDTVTWTNMGVLPHNVRADDNSFRCANGCDGEGGNGSAAGNGWSFTRTFNEPADVPYYCEVHGGPGGAGMAGSLTVEPAGQATFAINFGLIGSWFNPATPGQGFLFDLVIGQDPPQLVVYWFTFALEAGDEEQTRWLIAQGTYQPGSDRVMLDVFLVTGGVFDQAQPPTQLQSIGSALLVFESCTSATLTYDLQFDGEDSQQVTGTIPVQRLSPDVLCEELSQGEG